MQIGGNETRNLKSRDENNQESNINKLIGNGREEGTREQSNNSAQIYGKKKFKNDYNIGDTIVTHDNIYKQTHDHQYKLNGNADIFKTPQPKLSHKIQTIPTSLKDPHHVTMQGRSNDSKQNFGNKSSVKN